MSQKLTFHLFKEARRLNSYAEYPIFPNSIDPQIHISRNEEPQPFYLICDGDVVFTQASGTGALHFHSPMIRYYPLGPGDTVYVPAGTPHRFMPIEESVVIRAKAQFPKLEGVAWYCAECDGEVHRTVWDAHAQFCQEGYLAACTEFNQRQDLRTCPACSTVHPPVNISWNRWQEFADELREDGVATAPLGELAET